MTTPRTSPNGSATRAAKQARNSNNGSGAVPVRVTPLPQVAGPVGVFILDDINNSCRELARLELSAELFAHMKDVATGRKQTLGDFLSSALNANLPPAPAASVSESQLDPLRLSELEEASDQVAGLFELLERQFQQPLDFTPEGHRGLVQLGIKSCSRLREAVIGVGGAQ